MGVQRSKSGNECAERPSMNACRTLFVGMSLGLLSACSSFFGPEYTTPQAPSKSTWSANPTGIAAANAIQPDWWRGFQDPYLNSLIRQAVAQGIDLRILAGRIAEARAAVGQAQATRLPTVNATTQASVTRSRVEILPGEFADPTTTHQYSARGALNWEIDIWGKLRKGVEAQQAAVRASQADWRAGYLTLASDVASIYFLIRQLDEQRGQQQKFLVNNQQILAIYERQYRDGLVARTAVLQQRAEGSDMRQLLLEFERQRQVAENQLATLLGTPAGEFKVPVVGQLERVRVPHVPAGLPADMLSRRPDIIAAEYRVLQAYDLIGQARLARLPSFSLTANGGAVSSVLSSLLKGFTFGLAPAINVPIFDASLKANVNVNEARAKIAAQQYRRTVITAYEEVENALVSLAFRKRQMQALKDQLKDLRTVNEQVRAQLKIGLVSQLQVFESQRRLLSAELLALTLHQQILSDTITLYKALGGGWPSEIVSKTLQE